jgi:hypothetical protein
VVSLLESVMFLKLGTAIMSSTKAIVIVIINSTRVKPRSCRRTGPPADGQPPEFGLRTRINETPR